MTKKLQFGELWRSSRDAADFKAAKEDETAGSPSLLFASAKRQPYGVAVGCAVAGEEAGEA
jgi:hypothetical protein